MAAVCRSTLTTMLLVPVWQGLAAPADPARTLFADTFELHAVGAPLGGLQPFVGAGYVATEGTTIVATETLPGAPGTGTLGQRCVHCRANAARLQLHAADVAAATDQAVRFRFDVCLAAGATGGADIQTFQEDRPEVTRAFNLLLDASGTVSYYAGGAYHSVPGTLPPGTWAPVEVLADYRRHLFRARVGTLTFAGRFDNEVDRFTHLYFGTFGAAAYYYDNVVIELVPELADELAGALAASVSVEADLLRPLETGVSPFDVGTAAQLFVDRVVGYNSFAFRANGAPLGLRQTPARLRAGQPVKVVCLGDSVTGVYYHSGGRRAYPEMLGLALQTAYPQAQVTVVNAGISGNTSADGLRRLQADVLDERPDLVTVMFGLNDITRVPLAEVRANLGQVIERCRAAGAEVLLCTPNSVLETPERPLARLVEFCGVLHEIALQYQVPVCDVYAAYEALRERAPLAWRLLLSDEIHPNMAGHKLTAETLCRTICGQDISLQAAEPPQPALPRTQALLQAGRPVRVLAMPPYDALIGPALRALVPSAQVEVRSWPTAAQTLAEIETAAKAVRQAPPDLVLIAVPLAVTPRVSAPAEAAIRAHGWILNWSLSFGLQEWDVVAIAPAVLGTGLSPAEQESDAFACRQIRAQDLNLIARPAHDSAPPEQILRDWLRARLTGK